MNKTRESLGEKIVRLREARKWSQEKLAEISGVPRRTIQNMEKDAGSPGYDNVVAVLGALGVSDEVLHFEPVVSEKPELILAILRELSTLEDEDLRTTLDFVGHFALDRASSKEDAG